MQHTTDAKRRQRVTAGDQTRDTQRWGSPPAADALRDNQTQDNVAAVRHANTHAEQLADERSHVRELVSARARQSDAPSHRGHDGVSAT